MLRILDLVLAFLFALSFSVEAATLPSKQPVASGTVTQANARISAAAGIAFVDFSAADVLTDYKGHELHICDSANKCIIGVIKAAGTAETLATTGGPLNDGELITDPGFANDPDWTHGVMYTIAAGVLVGITTGAENCGQEVALTTGWLYKAQITTSGHVSGTHWMKPTSFSTSVETGGNATLTAYTTTGGATTSYFLVGSGLAGIGGENTFDNATFKHVLTPSATGVTIVTTKGGTTYNWAALTTGFNFNDVSGYTYQIYKLWEAPVVASGAVAAADSRLDIVNGGAWIWLNGVDLSPYQDGKHMIGVYENYSGKGVLGFISSVAPAGETLGDELVTVADDRTFGSDTGFWTMDGGWAISGGNANMTDGSGSLEHYGLLTAGQCYKAVGTYTIADTHLYVDFGLTYIEVGTGVGVVTYGISWGGGDASRAGFDAIGFTGTVDDISYKRVTEPPVEGALIVNTKGGATRNWLMISSGFTGDDALDYKVFYLGD